MASSLSKLHPSCAACAFQDTCSDKIMVGVLFFEPSAHNILENNTLNSSIEERQSVINLGDELHVNIRHIKDSIARSLNLNYNTITDGVFR